MRRLVVITTAVAIVTLGFLLPAYGDTVESRIAKLEAQVATLQSQVQLLTLTTKRALETVVALESQMADLKVAPTLPLKIAYLNAEDAFSVFTDAVKDLRQKAVDKQSEIVSLQQQFLASAISKEEFDTQNNQLQVELLQAQLNIDIGTIDRMIASPGFFDIRNDLERLREEAQPIIDEMKKLVSTVRVGIIDPQEFQNRYNQVKAAFTQLDQLLTQAATSKIVKAAEKIAVENGYDLVLRSKNVIIYRNTAKLVDITDVVKAELASYL